jgi:hypothetical protein
MTWYEINIIVLDALAFVMIVLGYRGRGGL